MHCTDDQSPVLVGSGVMQSRVQDILTLAEVLKPRLCIGVYLVIAKLAGNIAVNRLTPWSA